MSINDIELIECGFPLFPEEFPIDLPILTPSFANLTALSNQFEGLRLDVYIQSLRIEVELAKRQKLSANLKRVKREIISQRRLLTQIHQENALFILN